MVSWTKNWAATKTVSEALTIVAKLSILDVFGCPVFTSAALLSPFSTNIPANFPMLIAWHCVKSVHIRIYSVHIFPHSDWIRRDTNTSEYWHFSRSVTAKPCSYEKCEAYKLIQDSQKRWIKNWKQKTLLNYLYVHTLLHK